MSETRSADFRNTRIALICGGVVMGMTGLAFASVPLYDLFCKATGFGGSPVVGSGEAGRVLDRAMNVRFDTNVAPGLPWRFQAEAPSTQVKIGETKTFFYKVTNAGTKPATGVATFNVEPGYAAAYFVKLQCFCFKEQTLQPGETMDSAVVFYVDPAIADDPNLTSLDSLTLSYTYFPAKDGSPVSTSALSAPASPRL